MMAAPRLWPYRVTVIWLEALVLTVLCLTHTASQARQPLSHAETGPGIPHPFDFAFPDHLCGSLRETYMAINDRVRAACKEEAQAAAAARSAPLSATAAAAGSAGSSAAAAPPSPAPTSASPAAPAPPVSSAIPTSSLPSRCRTLIFDSGQDGYGDTVFGMASTFAVALLDERAFLMRQEWLPYAFEPATFDWRVTDDIPLSKYPPQITDENNPPNVTFARLILHNRNISEPEALFAKLQGIAHIGVVWNRGILFNLLTKGRGPWADRFRGIGLTPPYAFACVMRLLLRHTSAPSWRCCV
ncbi:hypothetical protein CLOM_g7998 [Closterium sp. NIES-68]|nr:hypothetical protein CLOM_g7998 [Closterium sp. NIES-68]GJP71673.1 hypothetical protein CLOP_g2484 [Closterium sp. NIES-67]